MKFILISLLFSSYAFASSEIDDVLNQARNIDLAKKESNGFKVSEISGESIFSRLGLREGDVIQKMNGKKINNLSDVIDASRSEIKSVEVLRGKETISLNYN